MKSDIYIHLISEFMLAKPGRPFDEVHIYAEEIGASEDDLKDAIFQVSKLLAERRIQARRSGNEESFEKFEQGLSILDEELEIIEDTPQKEPLFTVSQIEDIVKKKVEEALAVQQVNITKNDTVNAEGLQETSSDTFQTKSADEQRQSEVIHVAVHDANNQEAEVKSNLKTDTIRESKNTSSEPAQKQEKIVASVKKTKTGRLSEFKIRPHIGRTVRMVVLFLIAPVVIISSSLFVYQNSVQNQKNTAVVNKTENKTEVKKAVLPAISFGPPIVFASSEKIDAKRIFSYPQSEVSLDYSGTPRKQVFGFFPYWMLPVADEINIDLYSTIALFGLTTDGKGNIITSSSDGAEQGWSMWNSRELDQFVARAKKKRIKVVLTIKSFNNEDIDSLVASDEAQRKFISNAIQLINLKSLDGINIDFEYLGTPPQDATFGFTRLIANLNAEMKRQVPEAQLTIDTYLKSGGVRDLFDVQLLQDYVDAIVIMGYDVHTPNGSAGPVSPMEGDNGIIGFMQSYLERVSPAKLILAVPYYGYDWPIMGPSSDNVRAGILSYAEIAASNSQDSILWNEQTQTPYYQYQDPETNLPREVHFENARSLGIKYDYVNKKNLAGIGVWAMGYEGKTLELEQVILEKFAK